MKKNDEYPRNQFYSDWSIGDDEISKDQLKEARKDIARDAKDTSEEIKDESDKIQKDIKDMERNY